MKKTDSVYAQALKVSIIILLLGIIEFVLFTVFMSFRYDILIGTVYGCVFACLNFFYLAYSVKKAADKSESGAKAYMSISYTSRMLLTGAMLIVAAKVKWIYIWAAILPLFFYRIAVALIPFIDKRSEKS